MSKPEAGSKKYGLWGLLSFAWVNAPIAQARKGDLDLDDLYLPDDALANPCYDKFDKEWNSIRAQGKGRPLFATLLSLYGKRFFIGGLFKLGWSALVICGAFFFVRSLLLYVDEEEKDHPFTKNWSGWVLSVFFFLAAVLWGTLLLRGVELCETALRSRAISNAMP
jgi:hypothetical protein